MTGLESSHAAPPGPGKASRCRNLGYAIDDLAVCLGGFREQPLVGIIGLRSDARVVPIPGQPPAGLRAPRNDPEEGEILQQDGSLQALERNQAAGRATATNLFPSGSRR
jgi:hypothetical protein